MDTFIEPSDIQSFRQCSRKFWFDHQENDTKKEEDEFQKRVLKKANEHKNKVKNSFGEMVTATSPEHTMKLIDQEVPVIYQPKFVDEDLKIRANPDFLIRTTSGEYQVGEAKLSLNLESRSDIKYQLGMSRMLAGTSLPAKVFLRSGDEATVGEEYNDEVKNILSDMRDTLELDVPPERHFTHSDCSICPSSEKCIPEFERNGELTLVFGLNKNVANTLKSQGINTIQQLAEITPQEISDGPYLKTLDKKTNLVLQARSQLTGDIFEEKPPEFPDGTWVHFDVESHSMSDTAPAFVYLWGFLPPPYEKNSMEYVWSDDDPDSDRKGWNEVLELIEKYREKDPDLKLVHFSRYEVDRIKDYAQRYDMMENPTVKWLLGDDTPLVDLHALVKESLVLPLRKYGLKEICKDPRLVDFQWELEESGSQWSVVKYMDYLETTSSKDRESIKDEIVTYNRDDVLATRAVEKWLREAPWRSGENSTPPI